MFARKSVGVLPTSRKFCSVANGSASNTCRYIEYASVSIHVSIKANSPISLRSILTTIPSIM